MSSCEAADRFRGRHRADNSSTGIKFDKSILEFERDMALGGWCTFLRAASSIFETDVLPDGYRPYADDSGFVHLITLVRNDVWEEIQEHYQINVSMLLSFYPHRADTPSMHARPSSDLS